jgi:hypothetical protein
MVVLPHTQYILSQVSIFGVKQSPAIGLRVHQSCETGAAAKMYHRVAYGDELDGRSDPMGDGLSDGRGERDRTALPRNGRIPIQRHMAGAFTWRRQGRLVLCSIKGKFELSCMRPNSWSRCTKPALNNTRGHDIEAGSRSRAMVGLDRCERIK